MEIENRVSPLKLIWWIIRFLILYLLAITLVVTITMFIQQMIFKWSLIMINAPENQFFVITPMFAVFCIAYTEFHLKYIDKQNVDWLKIKLGLVEGFEFLKGFTGGILIFGSFLILFIIFTSTRMMFNEAFSLLSTVYVILALLLLAFFEEYVYRGYLYNLITKHSNRFWGIFISSLIFLIFHLANSNIGVIGIVNIFAFGVLLALIYERCKNLYLITGIHFIWNFLSVFCGFQVSGIKLEFLPIKITLGDAPEIITGGQFGPEGSIITTIILTVLIVWYILKTKNILGGKIGLRIFT
ncbi:CPBP family intramembrane metalloprotease [Candidatus Dependentiae bacterium]|nr:CPBP family intramembrane metalloprotease [Candidatus Dependentiae bacterium]